VGWRRGGSRSIGTTRGIQKVGIPITIRKEENKKNERKKERDNKFTND
jgi:hypothetical protein